MRFLLIIGKILKWVFILVILPILIYLLLAALLSYWGTAPKAVNCSKNKTIYLASNGMHIDIILPRSYVLKAFNNQINAVDSVQYYAFGWGDKGFYLDTPTWAELKASVAIKAMLMKSATAMKISQFENVQSHWIPQKICAEQLEIIHNHITSSFQLDKEGNIIEMPGTIYSPGDRFFEAEGHYTGLRTCNIWVSDALKKAGIKTSRWSPFVFGIVHHAEEKAASE